ncbi:hypothetical protein [Nocardia sp. bgisy134]|uniref:hypothetical protein n=1 Tax=Nocardia sp. bgisy134 TaxID=3413789 RepID=UPI003D7145A0
MSRGTAPSPYCALGSKLLAVRECHRALSDLADSGLISPLLSERLALADVAAGVQRLADGETVGRVVYDTAVYA